MAPKPTPRLNPRGDRGSRPPGQRPTSSLWYGLALLMVLGFAQLYFMTPPGRSVPYSEFKTLLKDNQVTEIVIGDQAIRGTLKQAPGADPQQSTSFTTTRVEDPKLTEELEARGVKYTGEVTNRWFAELLSWIIPLVFFVAIWGFFFRRMGGAEGGVMSFAKSRAKIYADDEVKVRFTDVAGVDEAEEELKEIVEFLKNPKKYTNLGGRIPKGVLLVGPPGTGKTLLARAVAGEAQVPFFSLSGSEFVEMFVGVGAARIRDLFQQAEAKAPCIVFIDELDALGKVRMQSPMGGHEEREQTLNQLLAEMDGFDAKKGVIIMGATNRPEVLDPALLRPGRFDRQVILDRPDMKGRVAILKVHTKGKPLDKAIEVDVIARQSPGFSGADLANLVNEAAILSARRNKKVIGMSEFGEALERIVAGPERKSRLISDAEKLIIAYHEGGHAVVQRILPKCDPVSKVTIISRGMALGYTMALPQEDRYLQSKTEFEDKIAGLLAGNAAERMIFGDTTTGSSNDIEKATDLSRRMVTEFGMSDRLGPLSFGKRDELVFLGREIGEQRNYSDEVAKQIDEEVRAIIDKAYERAMEVLETHRDRLEALAQKLIAEETVDSEEFEKLFSDLPPKENLHGAPPRIIEPGTEGGATPGSSAPQPSPNPQPA